MKPEDEARIRRQAGVSLFEARVLTNEFTDRPEFTLDYWIEHHSKEFECIKT